MLIIIQIVGLVSFNKRNINGETVNDASRDTEVSRGATTVHAVRAATASYTATTSPSQMEVEGPRKDKTNARTVESSRSSERQNRRL